MVSNAIDDGPLNSRPSTRFGALEVSGKLTNLGCPNSREGTSLMVGEICCAHNGAHTTRK